MIFIIINNLNGDAISFDKFFWSCFVSSLFSSAFALTKQLKVGPCQLMPRDKFGLTFMLIFFCNIFWLLGKGLIFFLLNGDLGQIGFGSFYSSIVLIITSILAPMILVSKLLIIFYPFISLTKLLKILSSFQFQQFLNLVINQGFKKSLTTAKDYPAMILLPAFSVWTYGSVEKGSCQNCQSSQQIGLSFNNSYLNVLYTLACVAVTAHLSFYDYEFFISLVKNLTFSAGNLDIFSMILVIPVHLLSIILMSVVACMDTCSCCSCSCCCDCLLPMTERTANTFGLQEETPTEIPLVEANPPASPKNETTSPLLIPSDANTIDMH